MPIHPLEQLGYQEWVTFKMPTSVYPKIGGQEDLMMTLPEL
jgi:hypothetical protein